MQSDRVPGVPLQRLLQSSLQRGGRRASQSGPHSKQLCIVRFQAFEALATRTVQVCEDLRNAIQDAALSRVRGDSGVVQCFLPPPGQHSGSAPPLEIWLAQDTVPLFSKTDTAQFRASQVRQLSLVYTGPATLLRACRTAGLHTAPRLTIHLVGARRAEAEQAAAWSLLPARLPDLKHLTIVLVGNSISTIPRQHTRFRYPVVHYPPLSGRLDRS